MPLKFPAIDSAIATFEGFGKSGVPATVNNNPGNLIAGDFSTAHGAIAQNGPFAVFPDIATGTTAQDALVEHYANKGLSLDQLLEKWAPPAAPGNSPSGLQSYQSFLSSTLGVPGTTDINTAEKKTPDASTNLPGSSLGTSTPSDQTSASWWNPIQNIANAYNMATGGNSANNPGGQPLSFARIGAFILGFVFIAGGLYLFKPVQETVNTAARGVIE